MSVAHERITHLFDNGIRVYDDHLTPGQRARYRECNVHEPEEERLFFELIAALPKHGRFVNVGCAVGYYLILAHQIRPDLRLYAVEPLKEHQNFLKENLSLNAISEDRVTLFPFAVSDAAGTATFLEKDYGSSLLPDRNEPRIPFTPAALSRLLRTLTLFFQNDPPVPDPPLPDGPVTEVETRRLDELIERVGGTVDLLQMDIQGWEARVLQAGLSSLQSSRIKALLIGTHSESIHRECVQILKSAGYRIEFSEVAVEQQPDGMILANHEVERVA